MTHWRRIVNKALLLVEVAAIIGLVADAFFIWGMVYGADQKNPQIHEADGAGSSLPAVLATPVAVPISLPGGYKRSNYSLRPEPGEADGLRVHALPGAGVSDSQLSPTPGPVQQANRIQIPAIDVDAPIVQGDDWEQLKRGVGQRQGSALPGEKGNLVLSGHNNVFGAPFRALHQLQPGDEVMIFTDHHRYTYVVRETLVVEPTELWVTLPTGHPSATLISCYPGLLANKRIVVFADLSVATLLSKPST